MKIQKADPEARRRAIWIVVLGAAAGVTLLLWLEHSLPRIAAWVTEQPELVASRGRLLLMVIGVLIIVPLLGFAAYLWFLGGRIARARRFPLPSMKVLRDTAVVVGPAAETHGRLVKALAVVLTAFALGLLSVLWWLAFFVQPRVSS